jgi:putative ABC transport system permease protein
MSRLRRFLARLLTVIRPGRQDASFEREIASHLMMLEDEYRRRGMSNDHARRAARLALGGVEQTKERHRDARSFRWLDDARRDAIYAARMLERNPLATATAVLSLASGIGLNAAIFSIVDWVLIRPLPYPAPHQLVRVMTAGTAPVTGPAALTHSEFVAFAASTAFREAAAFSTATRVMAGAGVDPVHVAVSRMAGDLFATLEVLPEIGRPFTREELSGGAPVVILSHQLWARRFSEDPSIAGRPITIDGVHHTVVGVMAAGRAYPRDADLWRPLLASEREDDDRDLSMIARLERDAVAARASVELATVARSISNGVRTAWADDVQRTDAGNVRSALQALFAAALLTLLIACANVAALIRTRGADRTAEMAVRGALGATRARMIAQLMTETLLLAVAGGAFGLMFGRWALTAMVAIAPVSVPRLTEISLDIRILGIGVAATMLVGLSVGLAPALRLSRLTTIMPVNRGGWRHTMPRSNGRRVLVAAQVAIAIIVTTGASVLIRSLQHLVTLEHGFAANELAVAELYLRGVFDGDSRQLFRDLTEQVQTLPGVKAAAVSMLPPSRVSGPRAPVRLIGERQIDSPATFRPVSRTYFDTAGIPRTAGRGFTINDNDKAPRVAIVNTTFVRDLLGNRSAVGLRLTTPFVVDSMSIVGVVADVTPAGVPDTPTLYVPVEQTSIGGGYLIVRAYGDPRSIIPELTSSLRIAAPGLAADRVRPLAEDLEESRAVIRFSTEVATTFAGLALLLSTIGVYGLAASEVSARWRELAVRLALGASHREALWTVIRPSAAILAAGASLGILGALSVGPALGSLLDGVGPADVVTMLVSPTLLISVGTLASGFAAMRVLRADPAATLRSD